MTDHPEVVRLLRSIDRKLSLVTAGHELVMLRAFQAEILRTRPRTAMWAAIDGKTSTAGLAHAAGASERLAQMFVKEMRESDFVRDADDDRYVEQNEDAVLCWHTTQMQSRSIPNEPLL